MAGASARAAGVGAWVHLQEQAVTVDPGATLTVPFVVTPPRGAAAGDHVGGIVTTRAAGAARGPADPAAGLRRAEAGAGGERRARRLRREREPGRLRRRDRVVHRAQHGQHDPERAPGGVGRGAARGLAPRRRPASADTPALPPGTSWTVSAPVRDVAPALRVRASVKVTPLLVDAAGSTSPLRAVSASGGTWALPWTLLVALILLVGLARRGGAPGRRAAAARPRRARGGGVMRRCARSGCGLAALAGGARRRRSRPPPARRR